MEPEATELRTRLLRSLPREVGSAGTASVIDTRVTRRMQPSGREPLGYRTRILHAPIALEQGARGVGSRVYDATVSCINSSLSCKADQRRIRERAHKVVSEVAADGAVRLVDKYEEVRARRAVFLDLIELSSAYYRREYCTTICSSASARSTQHARMSR
jgi:hypothetical protein